MRANIQTSQKKTAIILSSAKRQDATVEAALASIGFLASRLEICEQGPGWVSKAVAQLQLVRPSLVVLETTSATGPELQLCAGLSALREAPPRMVVLPEASPGTERAAVAAGCSSLLVRPLTRDALLSALSSLGLWHKRSEFRQPITLPMMWIDSHGRVRSGQTVDLSLSGISFKSPEPPPSHENIEIELIVPGFQGHSRLWVRVLRSEPQTNGSNRFWLAAGKVLRITPEDRTTLSELIRSTHRQAFFAAHPHRWTILDDYEVRQILEWTLYLVNKNEFDGPPTPSSELEAPLRAWVARLPDEELALFELSATAAREGDVSAWLRHLVAFRFRIDQILSSERERTLGQQRLRLIMSEEVNLLSLLDRSLRAWEALEPPKPTSSAFAGLAARVVKRTLRSALLLPDAGSAQSTADLPGVFSALRANDESVRDLKARDLLSSRPAKMMPSPTVDREAKPHRSALLRFFQGSVEPKSEPRV